jgi:hypothetical protein
VVSSERRREREFPMGAANGNFGRTNTPLETLFTPRNTSIATN